VRLTDRGRNVAAWVGVPLAVALFVCAGNAVVTLIH